MTITSPVLPASTNSPVPAGKQNFTLPLKESDQDTLSSDKAYNHPSGLSQAQLSEFARELDELRDEILADLGKNDAAYIRRIISIQRRLEVAGRISLFAGVLPPFWLAGVAMLGTAKILENMEIGHNILHGQWDWMRDPDIHSSTWEWDNTCPADQWKHSHNYMHHMWTNVIGKDRDVGYGILRMSDDQPWSRWVLTQPAIATMLAFLFEWGVALHDVEIENLFKAQVDKQVTVTKLKGIARKVRGQVLKDYVAFPALAGPFWAQVLTGNLAANLIRNLWSFTIIFCGHFPDGAKHFTEQDLVDETRGGWYARQVMGSANLDGGKLFHIMSGNLSHQIEHHIFPDMPSNRYSQIAPRVREICERHGISYTTGPLGRQFGQVVRRIFRLALPGKANSSPRVI